MVRPLDRTGRDRTAHTLSRQRFCEHRLSGQRSSRGQPVVRRLDGGWIFGSRLRGWCQGLGLLTTAGLVWIGLARLKPTDSLTASADFSNPPNGGAAAPADLLPRRQSLSIARSRDVALPIDTGGRTDAAREPADDGNRRDAATPAAGKSTSRVPRLLILGNSLTVHPASAELDWPGEWGMAASSKDRDYVHRLAAKIRLATGQTPALRVRNIANFERGYERFDYTGELAGDREFAATVIVLAIGENMEPLTGADPEWRFCQAVCRLVEELTRDQPATVLIRSGFWRSPRHDRALRSAACATGSLFVDCGDLGSVPENAARHERDFRHAAVAAHPGDRGMQALAERIWSGLKDSLPISPES